ncbi:hypothetical protein ACYX78_00175 [Advenella incenata]
MAQDNPYEMVEVESYVPKSTSGLRGKVHIRPVPGGNYSTDLRVECSKKLSTDYPIGTRFMIRATLTDREDGGEYLYSNYRWPVKVLP